jgi:hypothetical protein
MMKYLSAAAAFAVIGATAYYVTQSTPSVDPTQEKPAQTQVSESTMPSESSKVANVKKPLNASGEQFSIEQMDKDFETSQNLLKDGKGEEALALIEKYSFSQLPPEFKDRTDKWLHLEIAALTKTQSYPRLFQLYQKNPEAFSQHEDSIVLMAQVLVRYRKTDDFDLLRQQWVGKETDKQAWLLLDADFLIIQQKLPEARALLLSQKFEGKADIPRLVRLALISDVKEMKQAWEYLTEAAKIDPKNVEVRLFRGQMLEKINQASLALTEYVAAYQADPTNPYLRHAVADFYRRQGEFRAALQTWGGGLKENTADYLWLETLFWSKVTIPVKYEWKSAPSPKGNLKHLVDYLIDMDGKFWNEEKFQATVDSALYLKISQEVFWLRLLGTLQDGRESDALDMLSTNPFRQQSFNLPLENALTQVIHYRQSGKLSISTLPETYYNENAIKRHPFLSQLDELAAKTQESSDPIPAEIDELLKGPEAYMAVFAAAGWMEAGLQFHSLAVIPSTYPEWITPTIITMIVSNRTIEEALAFAQTQNKTPYIQLQMAELHLNLNQLDQALELMKPLMAEESAIGTRATVILSQYYASKKDYESARKLILERKDLAQETVGQEILAKIALMEGDEKGATSIYEGIQEKSLSARAYLAKQAFQNQDFSKARLLTEKLVQEYPNVVQFRQNLMMIDQMEKQKQQAAPTQGSSNE